MVIYKVKGAIMNFKVKLQQAINDKMKSSGITQKSLADHLGVSRQAVQIFLKTDNVGYEKLFQLASMVDLEVDLVIRDKEV
jgi:predicted XRE-type DNA-binding protein